MGAFVPKFWDPVYGVNFSHRSSWLWSEWGDGEGIHSILAKAPKYCHSVLRIATVNLYISLGIQKEHWRGTVWIVRGVVFFTCRVENFLYIRVVCNKISFYLPCFRKCPAPLLVTHIKTRPTAFLLLLLKNSQKSQNGPKCFVSSRTNGVRRASNP